jgi:hypothetical protein
MEMSRLMAGERRSVNVCPLSRGWLFQPFQQLSLIQRGVVLVDVFTDQLGEVTVHLLVEQAVKFR